ncbi:TlpA disulfide reductase family protein [Rhodanobacter sp. C03]|uniref:TlpA family protein disulfide reductase n=1 Tax=Rhodanobacter sp. C03 TaxID=1945858 RepID=UPI000984279A|nr:TlpA disulfide reductase family protein [Rhodanobacter sp. C03]OOG53756.1 redoxin [Rhodanobacter sp. C03]
MMDRSNWLILGLAVLVATIGGYTQHRNQQAAPAAKQALLGQPLPTLSLPGLDGKTHPLTDYHGRRLLLNFWASWCGPCLEEMPALNRAQEKFGEKGAIVVGIAMDEPDRVRSFLAIHPVSYPILLGQLASPSTSLQLGDMPETLPYSVLIGADGRILATHAGAMSTPQLEQWLASTPGQP